MNTMNAEQYKALKPRRRNRHQEHDEQVAFFQWVRANQSNPHYPYLWLCHASLNGIRVPIQAAVRLKAAGMLSGVWDVFYPYPHGGYGGLWIEFKIWPNKLSEEQNLFSKTLYAFYSFSVCYNWTEAVEAVKKYVEF